MRTTYALTLVLTLCACEAPRSTALEDSSALDMSDQSTERPQDQLLMDPDMFITSQDSAPPDQEPPDQEPPDQGGYDMALISDLGELDLGADMEPSDQGAPCSPCPEGYELAEGCGCVDLDECALAEEAGEPLCVESACVNHLGGHHCFEDSDDDGVDDWSDNCLGLSNPEQADLDSDGRGDLCDEDRDGDLSPEGQDCDDLNPYLGSRLQDSECDGAPDFLSGRANFSVGWRHTCAISDGGTLACWGGSPRIQEQQSGMYEALQVPLDLQGQVIDDWVHVAAGYAHTCGVRLGGLLSCWGYDHRGQSSPPLNDSGAPYRDWTRVTAGGASESFTCGLHVDGSVDCWGSGEQGQLSPPLDEQGEAQRWVDIHAGYQHVCGLHSDGRVSCWGSDQFGQSSPPSEGELDDLISEGFEGLSGPWLSVGAGYAHSCGLRAGGAIYCWGLNTESQSSPPNWDAEGRARRWSVSSVGGFHGCGVDERGGLVCWGSNYTAQSRVVTQTFGAPYVDWTEVVAGRHHSCGLRSNGELLCWGWNDQGQTAPPQGFMVRKPLRQDNCRDLYNPGQEDLDGDGVGDLCDPDPDGDGLSTEEEERWGLNPMSADSDEDGLSDSLEFGCERAEDLSWRCPEEPRHTSPSVPIDALAEDSDLDSILDRDDNCPTVVNVSQDDLDEDGVGDLCDLDQDGDGALDAEDCLPRDPSLSWRSLDTDCDGWLNEEVSASSLRSLGDRYSCMLLSDGQLRCAGFDMSGQVSDVPRSSQGEARRDWSSVSAGMNHSCGVAGGEILCWGMNHDGRGTAPPLPLAEDPSLGEPARRWRRVGVGVAHTCGETGSGVIRCWGNQFNGQDQVPTDQGEVIQDWRSWDVGGFHTCGLRSGGELLCWGGGGNGQVNVPSLGAAEGVWVDVSAGHDSTCALTSQGGLRCWGFSAALEVTRPALEPPSQWWQVSVGRFHACGLYDGGRLTCWGADQHGQLTPPEGAPEEGWRWVSAGGYHTCAYHDSAQLWCWGRDDHGESTTPPQWSLRAVSPADNCPFVSNPDQADSDGDGVGEACEDE